MKEDKKLSAPYTGMNRDVNHEGVKPSEVTFMMNGTSSNEEGSYGTKFNEPSNYLHTVFPENYKVIGKERDTLTGRTFYFLTNPLTRKSSIGYIDPVKIDIQNQDNLNDSCQNCNGSFNELEEPLEDKIQTPVSDYVELVNDICLPTNEGLNFDISSPIRKVQIKNEKSETTLYWEDYRNPSRYMNTVDVSYLYTEEIPCGEDVITNCLKPFKLLQQPRYNRPVLTPTSVDFGGNLKMGTYQFYLAYCDLQGNSITPFFTPTNIVPIFDQSNPIIEQIELDRQTSFGIKINIEGLDSNFNYYKVVCVERSGLNSQTSSFLEGVHSVDETEILYTQSGSVNESTSSSSGNVSLSKRVDIGDLYQNKPEYNRAKGNTVSNNRQYIWGLETKRTINLQPVVNLFSSLIKWQSAIAKEDLYKSEVACSNYLSYRRDEVQPFSMRFHTKTGGVTENFNFIGRPSIDNENTVISTQDTNYKSITEFTSNCNEQPRNKLWQYKNTAKVTGFCTDFENSSEVITETLENICKIEAVATIPSGSVNLELDDLYIDFQTYINENLEEILDPTSSKYIPSIASYLEDEYENENCKDETYFSNNCSEPVFDSQYNQISNVEGESSTLTEKDLGDYQKKLPPTSCFMYKINTSTGGRVIDNDFGDNFTSCATQFPFNNIPTVFVRDGAFNNEDIIYAETLANISSPSLQANSYYHNYKGAEDISDLFLDRESGYTDQFFYPNLHKGAQFHIIDKLERDTIIFEISKHLYSDLDAVGRPYEVSKLLRYTFYEDNTTLTPIAGLSGIVDLDEGILLRIDSTNLPSQFYVALDNPIGNVPVPLTREQFQCSDYVERFRTAPSNSCYSVLTRDVEYSAIKVDFDSIQVDKYQKYTAECQFFIPEINDCAPTPYAKGLGSFWESLKEYPNNSELYNSSDLIINESDLSDLEDFDKSLFREFYTEGVDENNNYLLNSSTDFRCKKIRHFKFPDNSTSPFINSLPIPSFSDTYIFPIGIEIPKGFIQTILRVALNNNLLTQEEFNNIESYEIFRGDSSIQKSVVASGLLYDMYKYDKQEKEVWYSNYPHNDLGNDIFNTTDTAIGKSFIRHPYNSQGNNMYSLISPEMLSQRTLIPNELKIEGYQVGDAANRVISVEDHPKWTILGDGSRTLATFLAALEVTAETIIASGEALSSQWVLGGLSTGASLGTAGGVLAVSGIVLSAVVRSGRYRYQWLETFKNLGTAYNFAHYLTSISKTNKLLQNTDENNILRAITSSKELKSGNYVIRDRDSEFYVNNWNREKSIFIRTGSYKIDYPTEYSSLDNNLQNPFTSSKSLSSQQGCTIDADFNKKIGSPYVTLKNYLPEQFGEISNIKWVNTNSISKINKDNSCQVVFGGDTYISRFTWKKKIPFFTKDLVGGADKQPFNYSDYPNIGEPTYYCDYEEGVDDNSFLSKVFPNIKSDYFFDCASNRRRSYIKPPSKFYLYSYGIVNFMVESTMNFNFRYAKNDLNTHFYPQNSDVEQLTQQNSVPITSTENIYYNNVYSTIPQGTYYNILDVNYSEKLWETYRKQDNAVIVSEPGLSENDNTDSWRVFKPLNWYEFPTKYGKLIDFKDIESGQLLGRFENQLVLFNAIDNLADRITPQTKDLGIGAIFRNRPFEYKGTDLGYAGTQHSEMVSTPFGHFGIDAKRGKIFQLDQNGGNLRPISDFSNGKPSNLKEWFKEQLPFKILKYFPQIDIDNNFRGLGITMCYDARKERLFITKRDYIPLDNSVKYDSKKGLYINKIEEENFIEVTDNNYFEDVSWTISYKLETGEWESYFSFAPDYYDYHNDFFNTGYNWGVDKGTLWNHPLNNYSFQVFQGKLNPFIIELSLQNRNVNTILSDLKLNIDAKRYQNLWDYSQNDNIGFNKLVIYNNTNNSGLLNLNLNNTSYQDKYPITNSDNTQDIGYTVVEGEHQINYFFNRVKNQNNNIPQWIWDKNRISKSINSRAVSFKGKPLLEDLVGKDFKVRLIQDKESRYNINLKNIKVTENQYDI